VDKLKARMNRWQAYVDSPQGATAQQTAVRDEPEEALHQSRTAHRPERQRPHLLEPARGTPSERNVNRSEAASHDALTDLQEARIADLKVAIAREREQADRLAEEVRREQRLHAATLYSHLVDERARSAESYPTLPSLPDALPMDFEDARRKNLVRLIGLVLIITSVLTVVFFVSR
jgi:hypothetical protein